MAGYQTNLSTGFAQLISTVGIASFSSTGAYAADATGIYFNELPAAADSGVALTVYPVSDDATLSDTVSGLQVMSRAGGQDPRSVDDNVADPIFDLLHGLHDVTLASGIRVVSVEHRGGGSMGQDEQRRWSRSDNYYVTTWRPSPNRQ